MKQYLKRFAESIWFDALGVALVVGIAIYSGYLGTRLDKFVDWGSSAVSDSIEELSTPPVII